ncbi:MAG: EMC3/TMCO1 family protein [Promethearchaeota archaeon]
MDKYSQKKKRKRYKKRKIDPKRLIMIVTGLSILIFMILLFSLLDRIPYGSELRSIIQTTPYSAIFILLFSLTINLCSTLMAKALIDTKELQRKMNIIKEFKKEKKDVEKLKDVNPSLYRKKMIRIKRRENAITKMTQNISMERMKPSCMTFLPMIILFFFIRTIFQVPSAFIITSINGWPDITVGGAIGVAKPVMNPFPELRFLGPFTQYIFPSSAWAARGYISFTGYYFLCSFSVGIIVQRLSGLSTAGMGMGMPGMKQDFK